MSLKNHLWVVEIRIKSDGRCSRKQRGPWGRWVPTTSASLTRAEGRKELAEWRERRVGTHVRLRLRKYRRVF